MCGRDFLRLWDWRLFGAAPERAVEACFWCWEFFWRRTFDSCLIELKFWSTIPFIYIFLCDPMVDPDNFCLILTVFRLFCACCCVYWARGSTVACFVKSIFGKDTTSRFILPEKSSVLFVLWPRGILPDAATCASLALKLIVLTVLKWPSLAFSEICCFFPTLNMFLLLCCLSLWANWVWARGNSFLRGSLG